MIHTFIVGMIIGFCLSIPIGPINLTVINEAFRKGFSRAFLLGLGGIAADIFYCTMAFMGLSSVLSESVHLWFYLQIMSGFVMVGIGVRYFLIDPTKLSPMARRTESKISHFRKAFPIGFLMGISNPGLFVLWSIVYTLLISHRLLKPEFWLICICIAGIAIGSACWFLLIAVQVSRTHHKIDPKILGLIARVSAVVLIGFGIAIMARSWIQWSEHLFR